MRCLPPGRPFIRGLGKVREQGIKGIHVTFNDMLNLAIGSHEALRTEHKVPVAEHEFDVSPPSAVLAAVECEAVTKRTIASRSNTEVRVPRHRSRANLPSTRASNAREWHTWAASPHES